MTVTEINPSNTSLVVSASAAALYVGSAVVSTSYRIALASISMGVDLASQAAPNVVNAVRVGGAYAFSQAAVITSGALGLAQQGAAPLLSAKVLIPLGAAGIGVTVIALTAVVLISPARGVVIKGAGALLKGALKVVALVPKAFAGVAKLFGALLKGTGKGLLKIPGKVLHLLAAGFKGLLRLVLRALQGLIHLPGKLLRSGFRGLISLPRRIVSLVTRAFKALCTAFRSIGKGIAKGGKTCWKLLKAGGKCVGHHAGIVSLFLLKHHNLFLYLGALAVSSGLLISSGLVAPQLIAAGVATRIALEAFLWYTSPFAAERKDGTSLNPALQYGVVKLFGSLECPDITGLNQNKRFTAITAGLASVALASAAPEVAAFGLAFQVASLALAFPFQAIGKPALNAWSNRLDTNLKLGSIYRNGHPYFFHSERFKK